MFESTRIKLTLWYLLIILAINFLFSLIIYSSAAKQLDLGFKRAATVNRARELGLELPRGRLPKQLGELFPELENATPGFILKEEWKYAKESLTNRLIFFNIVILGAAAFVSYYLAGQSLEPISNAMKEQKRFISDAAHELKTPLAALKAAVEVDLSVAKNAKTKKSLEGYLQDIKELEDMALKLLRLSKLSSKTVKIKLTNTDLKKVIKKVVKKIQPLADKKKIKLSFSKQTESAFAKVDKSSFAELLTILLDNAIKFSKSGGEVSVRLNQTSKQTSIGVIDSGIGIAKKDLPNIFKRFYQTNQARTKGCDSGCGLGLSIAQEIVKIHDGQLKVKSNRGKGSTFSIILPL